MRKIEIIIERFEGGFSAYMTDNNLTYSVVGDGKTVEEAITDIEESYLEMKEYHLNNNKRFEEVEFEYKFTIAAFLQYYTNTFTLVGLSHITGVNKGQLSHYINGYRKPGKRTADRIKSKVKDFAEEIREIRFI